MGKITIKKSLRRAPARVLNFLLLFSLIVPYGLFPKDVFASSIFPSTNEINKVNNWAHVNEVSKGIGEVTLEFKATRGFYSCFEYRTDGDTSQMTSPTNHNPAVTDGLYPYYCQNNNSRIRTILANEYVEVRLAFGAETDERFDWTKFDVITKPSKPTNGTPHNISIPTNNFDFKWDSSVGIVPISYEFQSSLNPAQIDGVLTSNLWKSGILTSNMIHSSGAPDGIWYWQVRAVDNNGNKGDWSDIWNVTLDSKSPSKPNFISPENNLFTNVNFIKLEWTGGDDTGSGVKGYILGYTFTPANGGVEKTWNTGLRAVGNPYWHSGTYGHGEGKYIFWVKTVDKAGNESPVSETLTVTYDKTAPLMPSGLYFWDVDNNKAVQCGGYSNTRHINEHWDATSDINFSHYEYSSFNAPNGSAGLIKSVFYTNYFNSSWWNIPTEGTYGFQVRTLDLAGNISPWAFNDIVGIGDSCKITIDWTAPIVQITSPSDSEYINGTVDFRGTVQDTNLLRYYYYIQNTTSETVPTDINLDDALLYTWDTTAKPDGQYELRLEARDKANNKDNTLSVDSIKVIVDNTAPIVEIVNPEEGDSVKGEVIIQGNVKDLNLSHYNISIYDGDADVNDFSLRLLSKTEYTTEFDTKDLLTWDTTLFTDGEYQIRLAARDLAGNRSEGTSIEIIKVTVDNTAPILEVLPNVSTFYSLDLPEIKSSITEENEIEKVCINIPGQSPSEYCIQGDTTEMDITSMILQKLDTPVPVGQYTIQYYAYDVAGNQSTIYSFLLTILTPTPQQNGLLNAQQAVLGTATTNGGTKRNNRATTTALDQIENLLGTGGPQDSFLDSESDVKGSQTCENPKSLSGYVYIDENDNSTWDEKEKTFSEVSLRIYTITDGTEETVKQIVTDENGHWETELCIGDYFVSLNTETLPNRYVVDGDETKGIGITESDTEFNLNYPILDERNFLQKYWPWILLAVGILGSIGIVALDTKRKKEYI